MRHLCSNLKINAGNKQVSSSIHQACNISQTTFCNEWLHVAKKVAGYNDVLRPKNLDQLWRTGITKLPRNPLPEPGFNSCLVTFPIKHLLHFVRGQSLKNRAADQLAGVGSVNAFFGKIQYFL